MAASAVFAQATSQPPVGLSGPQQAKASGTANKASEAPPFASAAKVPLPPPQASAAESSPDYSQPSSHKPWTEVWREKLRDDPIVAFTLVLAISTVLLWIDTRGLRHLAQRQATDTAHALEIASGAANAAKKSADASLIALRPWLSCDIEIVGPLTFDGIVNGTSTSPLVPIKFTITNVGHTPVAGVRLVFPQFNLRAPGFEDSRVKLERMARDSAGLPVRGGTVALPGGTMLEHETGDIIFPGRNVTITHQMTIDRRLLEKACSDLQEPRFFDLELLVLVAYAYRLSDVYLHTAGIYGIAKSAGRSLILDETLAAHEMRIDTHFMGGGFAI